MTTQFAVYRDHEAANHALMDLQRSGVAGDRVSVFLSERVSGLIPKVRPSVPEGAVAGGALGAVLAGLGGAAVLALPGVGLLAAGPLALLLHSAMVGAVGGGFMGALVGIGVPEHQAKLYAESLMQDGVIVAVVCDDVAEAALVEEIFERTRGVDLVRADNPRQSVHVAL